MRRLCQTLQVHPSGYYAWLAEPKFARAKEDQRLLGLIKHAWLESGGVSTIEEEPVSFLKNGTEKGKGSQRQNHT